MLGKSQILLAAAITLVAFLLVSASLLYISEFAKVDGTNLFASSGQLTESSTATASSSTSAPTALGNSSGSTEITSTRNSVVISTITTTNTSSENGTVEIILPVGVGMDESLNFQPAKLTVEIGVNNTIVWNDLDSMQHTVTSTSIPPGASPFDSGVLNQGQTFTVTLTVPGIYKYVCTVHPNWMDGTIKVTV